LSNENKWGLTSEFFDQRLGGPSILLLDGVDEAPARTDREQARQDAC
jgi:hypothetical protein